MPSEEALTNYNASYFDSAHGGQRQDISSNAFYSAISQLRGDYLAQYLRAGNNKSSRVLEIGPGPGFFAKNWIRKHSPAEYFAIETDETCHASLNGAGVKILQQSDFNNLQISMDIVVMSHVLEHVSDPRSFIAFAAGFLRKGGVLFIEVPCRDWEHKPLDEPHLLFFEKAPMIYLLNEMGFENIQTAYYGQKISSLKKRSFIKDKLRSVYTRLINMGFGILLGVSKKGMEEVDTAVERATVKPFMAHVESAEPTWWLRAAATKQ
jgi:SAM-dependent methyltransferase